MFRRLPGRRELGWCGAQTCTHLFHYNKTAIIKTRMELCKSIKQFFQYFILAGGLSPPHPKSLGKQASSWNKVFFNLITVFLTNYTVISSHLLFISHPWQCDFYPSLFEISCFRITRDLSADRHASFRVFFSAVVSDFTAVFYKRVL